MPIRLPTPLQPFIDPQGGGFISREWYLALNQVAQSQNIITIDHFFPGAVPASETLWAYSVTQNLTFPQGLTNSSAICVTPPEAPITFTFQRNGVTFGTITFSPGINTALIQGAATQFIANFADSITLISPNRSDSKLRGIGWTLTAQLQQGGT